TARSTRRMTASISNLRLATGPPFPHILWALAHPSRTCLRGSPAGAPGYESCTPDERLDHQISRWYHCRPPTYLVDPEQVSGGIPCGSRPWSMVVPTVIRLTRI